MLSCAFAQEASWTRSLNIPLSTIWMDALPRDRSTLDANAMDDLQSSIVADGLKQPIEVWKLSTPHDGFEYGLISGLRRLTAHNTLNRLRPDAFTTIPAFIRSPKSIPAAMAAMIAENEIRADLSPWDKGRVIAAAVQDGMFDTIEAAANELHPTATRQKRGLLRSLAFVVDELEGHLTTPENLSQRQMLHLASALRGGLIPLIHQILKETRGQSLTDQWQSLLPTLQEADLNEPETPTSHNSPERPRRLLELKQGMTIRRELHKDGWLLRFSGPQARKGGLMDDVMDKIEFWFQPGGAALR